MARCGRSSLAGARWREIAICAQCLHFLIHCVAILTRCRRAVIAQLANSSSKFATFEHQSPRVTIPFTDYARRMSPAAALDTDALAHAVANAASAPAGFLSDARRANRQMYGCLLAAARDVHCAAAPARLRGAPLCAHARVPSN